MAIEKIGKFEKNNSEVSINVLFESKKKIYIARRSEYNRKRSKQVNLLMIVDGENRHYTAINCLSRLLKSMNAKHKEAYHCLNGFHTEKKGDDRYRHCSSHGKVNTKMPEDKDKWLKFYDSQNQYKVPFMLYADFESILKPVEKETRGRKRQKAILLVCGENQCACTVRLVVLSKLLMGYLIQ